MLAIVPMPLRAKIQLHARMPVGAVVPVMSVSAVFAVVRFLDDDVVTTCPQTASAGGRGGVRRDRYGAQRKGPGCGNKPAHSSVIRHLFSFSATM
jgi:hypothetical protein